MPFYARKPPAAKARKPVRRPTRRPRKTTRKGVSTAVKDYVKKSIHSNIENKIWIDYGLNQTINTANLSIPVFKNLIPTLSQGTQQSQRIGNEVRCVKAVMKGQINLLPYNISSNDTFPIKVKMWLLKSKRYNQPSSEPLDIASQMFQVGNSTQGPQGNMLDMEFPINKDLFTVFSTRTFHLNTTSFSTFGGSSSFNPPDNSRVSQPFYFDFSKHLKAKVKYNDGSTYATNNNLYMVFQAVTYDGATKTTSSIPCEFHYTTTVHYEDA